MAAQIKGNQIILAKKYFSHRFGAGSLERVYKTMPEKSLAAINKAISSGSWESEEVYIEFLAKADETLGVGDYKLDWDCGRYIAAESIPTIYKIFIKFGDPMFVIERADRFWHQVHTSGDLQVSRTGDKSVMGRLIGKDSPHKAFCASLCGYFYGTLELCGVKNISVNEIRCASHEGTTCEYAVSWE